jgi:hypothetical protein
MSWFTPVLDILESAGSWMEDNPVASSLLGGAAAGAADYYVKKEAQKAEESYQDKAYQRRLESTTASSGSSNYSDYAGKLTGGRGLLTNGVLAGK